MGWPSTGRHIIYKWTSNLHLESTTDPPPPFLRNLTLRSQASMSSAHRESFLRILRALEREGLSLPMFMCLANGHANGTMTLTSDHAPPIDKTQNIYLFIMNQDMTVLGFLLSLLNPLNDRYQSLRREWLADGPSNTRYVLQLLKMIKSLIYSSGNGQRVWENYIYSQVCTRTRWYIFGSNDADGPCVFLPDGRPGDLRSTTESGLPTVTLHLKFKRFTLLFFARLCHPRR